MDLIILDKKKIFLREVYLKGFLLNLGSEHSEIVRWCANGILRKGSHVTLISSALGPICTRGCLPTLPQPLQHSTGGPEGAGAPARLGSQASLPPCSHYTRSHVPVLLRTTLQVLVSQGFAFSSPFPASNPLCLALFQKGST